MYMYKYICNIHILTSYRITVTQNTINQKESLKSTSVNKCLPYKENMVVTSRTRHKSEFELGNTSLRLLQLSMLAQSEVMFGLFNKYCTLHHTK